MAIPTSMRAGATAANASATATAVLSLLAAVWISVLVVQAASAESIGEGMRHILASPWASAALADYGAGLTLSLPWILVVGPSAAANIAWGMSLVVLGNAVLVVRLAVRLVSLASVDAALFPDSAMVSALLPLARAPDEALEPATEPILPTALSSSSSSSSLLHAHERPFDNDSDTVPAMGPTADSMPPPTATIRPKPFTRTRFATTHTCIIFTTLIILAMYIAVTTLAIVRQPNIAEGWASIRAHPWSYLAFIDNIVGVMVTGVYIFRRESPRSLSTACAIILSLAILGNAVTCVYVIGAVWDRMSLRDAVLVKRSVFKSAIRLGDDDDNDDSDHEGRDDHRRVHTHHDVNGLAGDANRARVHRSSPAQISRVNHRG